jgi:Protein of unknown function (DUF2889)
MPLSPASERSLLHRRDIALRGFERQDGLFDIEAELSDRKTHGFANEDRGWIGPEDRLHGMAMRMTVDDGMTIVAFEAVTDDAPYAICPNAAANFTRLVGLRIGRGFLRAAAERVGGTQGCTHLRELLQQMATVAYQTVKAELARRQRELVAQVQAHAQAEGAAQSLDARVAAGFGGPPALLNTCYAYASDGPVVLRRWPEHYTGVATEAADAEGGA